jgi:hypothetical protein
VTPIHQTIYAGDPSGVPGNCLQAALASMLDLPLTDVPHFVADDVRTDGDLHWWTEMRRWCLDRGLSIRGDREPEPGECYLGGGPSPRDPVFRSHVAVYRDGHLEHDPHPDGTGVVEVRTRWTVRPQPREQRV